MAFTPRYDDFTSLLFSDKAAIIVIVTVFVLAIAVVFKLTCYMRALRKTHRALDRVTRQLEQDINQ